MMTEPLEVVNCAFFAAWNSNNAQFKTVYSISNN